MESWRASLVALKLQFDCTNRIHNFLLLDAHKREVEELDGELWRIVEADCHKTAEEISSIFSRHSPINDLDAFWSSVRGHASGVQIVTAYLPIYERKVSELLTTTRRIMKDQEQGKKPKEPKAKRNATTALRGAKKTILRDQSGAPLNLKKPGALLEFSAAADEESVAKWLSKPLPVGSESDEEGADQSTERFPSDPSDNGTDKQ
ncbi:uncharacterized protein RSE6_01181 [Rhynchosporium secalis]|uniref:Uncharacterized protein n=1 Tax=Rhynchosporium secalis TaxID=38038 RepID=A0A1E1LX63_RHYSE|nr:uncharacterized protein RSE6_01181 [Rhynchosporium secalis]